MLGTDHHVIDVAVVLKCFLRQLPEPLIPYSFHELFLRCSLIENKVEALLLACLLIPTEHLNVLCYLMQVIIKNSIILCLNSARYFDHVDVLLSSIKKTMKWNEQVPKNV